MPSNSTGVDSKTYLLDLPKFVYFATDAEGQLTFSDLYFIRAVDPTDPGPNAHRFKRAGRILLPDPARSVENRPLRFYVELYEIAQLAHSVRFEIRDRFGRPSRDGRYASARLDDPAKNWKFSIEDLKKRKDWDRYMEAFEEMLHQCTTEWAPWHVIPANQKWYRNLAIAKTLVETLRQLDPRFPPAEEGIANIRIE